MIILWNFAIGLHVCMPYIKSTNNIPQIGKSEPFMHIIFSILFLILVKHDSENEKKSKDVGIDFQNTPLSDI